MKREIIKKVLGNLILESRLVEFEKLVADGKMRQDQFDSVWNSTAKRWRNPFNDDDFRKILFNSYDQGQAHEVSYFLEKEPEIKRKILNPMRQNRMALPIVEVPGVSVIDLNSRIKPDFLLTIDECTAYIEASEETDSKSRKLKEILYNGIKKRDETHFEIIYKDQNVIITYPKTYLGSIATARMGPDFNYYTPGSSIIGNMNWCTSVASGNNMFLNYHRKLNLHMYYITKIGSNFSKEDRFRKSCVSMLKKYGRVDIADKGGATVDGNNRSIKKEDVARAFGPNIYKVIFDDASKPNRQEIDEQEYYKSITLGQFKTLEAAAIASEDGNLSISLFVREIHSIVDNTNKIDLLRYIAQFKEYYKESYGPTIFNICLKAIKSRLFQNAEKIFLIEDMLTERKKRYNEDIEGSREVFSSITDIYNSLKSDKEKNFLFEIVNNSGNDDLVKMIPLMVGIDQFSPQEVAIAMISGKWQGFVAAKLTSSEDPVKYMEVYEEIIKLSKGGMGQGDLRHGFSTIGHAAAAIIAYHRPDRNFYSIIPRSVVNQYTLQSFINAIRDFSIKDQIENETYLDDNYNLITKNVSSATHRDLMITREEGCEIIAKALIEYGSNTSSDISKIQWILSNEINRMEDEDDRITNILVKALLMYKFYNLFVIRLPLTNLKISELELKSIMDQAKSENYEELKSLHVNIMNVIAKRGLDLSIYLGKPIDSYEVGEGQSNIENLAERMAIMTQYFLSFES